MNILTISFKLALGKEKVNNLNTLFAKISLIPAPKRFAHDSLFKTPSPHRKSRSCKNPANPLGSSRSFWI